MKSTLDKTLDNMTRLTPTSPPSDRHPVSGAAGPSEAERASATPHDVRHLYAETPAVASQGQLFASPQEQKTSDDYYTPQWIFEALGLHFDLDVASPPHATHVPCDRYYTIEDDGLNADWHGRVWMNPPFSKATPWVQRWQEHANGIALLPLNKSAWLNNLWNDTNAMCVPLPPTLKFVGGSISIATALWAIGHDNIRALHNIGTVR